MTTNTSPAPENLDELKFKLEQRKVELEELRYKRDNRFFNKNFGVIITSIISAATIIVSVTQLYISSNYNAGQLQNERDKNARSFAFEVAKFLMERRDEIISDDVNKAKYFRAVVVSSFPADVAAQVATSLRDTFEAPDSSPVGDARGTIDVRSVWAESAAYSQSKMQQVALPVAGASAPAKSKLTPDLVSGEFKELASNEAKNEIKLILEKAPEFGIISKDNVDIYLALVLQNTAFLRMKKENLNYSAQRLITVWPRFFNPQNVQDFANKPEAIANKIYGGRLGNTQEGDGWRFIGRGYMQITGRAAYRDVGNALNLDLEANPDKMLEPETNARASAYLFNKYTEAARKAGSLDIVKGNIAINGGLIGLDQTKAIYERIRKLTS